MIGEPSAAGEPGAWELRESRELLDTIITCAPVGFGLFDPAMRFVHVNEELAGIGGSSSADDLVGKRPHEVMPPPWAEALAGPFRRVLDTGEPMDDLEVAAPTAADPGRDHTWLASWYPVRHDGEIVAVGVFAHRYQRPGAGGAVPPAASSTWARRLTRRSGWKSASRPSLPRRPSSAYSGRRHRRARGVRRGPRGGGRRPPRGGGRLSDRLIAVPRLPAVADVGTLTLRMGAIGLQLLRRRLRASAFEWPARRSGGGQRPTVRHQRS